MTSEKRIHRAKHDTENPYYIASRDTAQDKSVSYDALGMLNYILSKPDDWIIQPSDLEREKCKRNKVYSILKELISTNYVERIYHRNEKKQVVLVEYIAHEKPLVKKPLPEKPEMGKPKVENRHSTEYRELQSTETTNTTTKKPVTETALALIKAWVEAAEFVDMGQSFATTARLKKAKAMLQWPTPATVDEVRTYTKHLKETGKALEFNFFEDGLSTWRSQQAPKPANEPKRGRDGFTDLERARLIHAEVMGEGNHDGA